MRDALQDAMELALATSVRCVDVASLVAASVLRKNRSATVLPFDYGVVPLELNSRDSVRTLPNGWRLITPK